MTTDPQDIQNLFLRIVALPVEERSAAIDQECGDAPELRQRVEELLSAHDEQDSFLDESGGMFEATLVQVLAPTAEYRGGLEPGQVISDRYTLKEKIGEGGMGEVWVAKQSEPVKRKVALKLIKTGMDSKAVLQRFEQERQALAMMDHPHIARVFDGGITTNGQPFFVMELVNGLPLDKYCDAARLTPNQRLELFIPICQAVQHAHQKGIVHRDLKPANILVTLVDGRPVPKVIDFGVAKATSGKLTEETMTQFGAVIGTLEYMSPEQAGFSSDDIDTRADIYSLGVILYELLTGLRPIDGARFRQAALTEMIRLIREDEPSKPSTRLSTDDSRASVAALRQSDPKKLTALLRGELDWVVMKCLEKQRDRRYETANSLLRDIQRYLSDEPVEARPPSAAYRLQKFLKRNKGTVVAASLVLVTLLGGIIGTTFGLIEAKHQAGLAKEEQRAAEAARDSEAEQAEGERQARKRAVDAEAESSQRADELKHQLGVSNLNLAKAAFENRDVALTFERLDRVPIEQRDWAWRYLNRQATGGIFTLNKERGAVYSVACSPDGTQIATYHGAWIRLWDANTGALEGEFKKPSPEFGTTEIAISYSPDGNRILCGGGATKPTVYNLDGDVVDSLDDEKGLWAVYSPVGDRILSLTAVGAPRVWHNGKSPVALDAIVKDDQYTAYSFLPDGKRVVGPNGQNIGIWDADKGGPPLSEWKAPESWNGWILCTAASPDGTKIIAGYGGSAHVLDSRDGTPLFSLKHGRSNSKAQGVYCAAFSPDNERIVTAGVGTPADVIVWDAETGEKLLDLIGHQAQVYSVAFTPDSKRIITGSQDGTTKAWDTRTGVPRVELHLDLPNFAVSDIAFSPDGKQIVTATGLQGSPLATQPPDRRKTRPVSAWVWDAWTGERTLELKDLNGVVQCVTFSPDGTRIVTGGWADVIEKERTNMIIRTGNCTVWDAKTGNPITREFKDLAGGVFSLAFDSEGKRVATAGMIRHVRFHTTEIEAKIWDVASGEALIDMTGRPALIVGWKPGKHGAERGGSVDLSRDGTRVVFGGLRAPGDNGFNFVLLPPRVCDARTGKMLFELPGDSEPITNVAFSPDSTKVVVCHGIIASVWDVTSSPPQELVRLLGHTDTVYDAKFSPDNREIATGSGDGTVRVWDVRTGTSLMELAGPIGEIHSVAFSPDGTRLAAGSSGTPDQSAQAYIWDAPRLETAPE